MGKTDRMFEMTVGGEVLYFATARDLLEATAWVSQSVRSSCRAVPGARRQGVLLVPTEVRIRMPRNALLSEQARAALSPVAQLVAEKAKDYLGEEGRRVAIAKEGGQ